MRVQPALLLPLLLGSLLAACATPAKLARVPGAPFAAVPADQTWSLSVTGCDQPRTCEDVRDAVAGQLVQRGLAARLATRTEPARIAISVDLGPVHPATITQRALFGATLGAAQRQARVMVADLRTIPATPLRSFTVQSASVVHPFSLEAGVQDDETRFGAEIADGLRP